MKIPEKIRANLLLKMTSLNGVVIAIRLLFSIFIQRLLAQMLGETGVSKIGQFRNLTNMLVSFSSLGIFNGVVKYVAEYKEDQKQLQRLFSTSFLFVLIGSLCSFVILFCGASIISEYLFATTNFTYVIKILSICIPFIGIQRVFNGVINGLSAYKRLAKIELISYLLSSLLTVIFLYLYNIDGVLVAIAIAPIIQLITLLFVFFKVLKEYINFSTLKLSRVFSKNLFGFVLMSFCSTILLNYVEIGIRSTLIQQISEHDAGVWTAMTNISKNYMVFSGAIFSMYVLPKFSSIKLKKDFKRELIYIYKTLLPLFAIGMLLVYLCREWIVNLIYPNFEGLETLFKWQLMGDFMKLASVVLAHQFLAKKLVANFIITEILSLVLFYGFSYYLIPIFGIKGVVISHLIRYIIYGLVVFLMVNRYFDKD